MTWHGYAYEMFYYCFLSIEEAFEKECQLCKNDLIVSDYYIT